jgi:hypothetical protein
VFSISFIIASRSCRTRRWTSIPGRQRSIETSSRMCRQSRRISGRVCTFESVSGAIANRGWQRFGSRSHEAKGRLWWGIVVCMLWGPGLVWSRSKVSKKFLLSCSGSIVKTSRRRPPMFCNTLFRLLTTDLENRCPIHRTSLDIIPSQKKSLIAIGKP